MTSNSQHWIYIGLDLGQRRDHTAIAVVERAWEQSSVPDFLRTGLDGKWWFRVRMLERLPLGTPYPDIVHRVKQIAALPQIAQNRSVVVDGTGVGAPAPQERADLLRRAGMGCSILPIIITGGATPLNHLHGGYETVPRSELLTAMPWTWDIKQAFAQDRVRESPSCRISFSGRNYRNSFRDGEPEHVNPE